MRKHIFTVLIVLVFVVGLAVMLYPTFSDWYNSKMNSYVVSDYAQLVSDSSTVDYAQMLQDAIDYNENLHSLPTQFVTGEAEDQTYIDTLNVYDGMMGYISIESIGVQLPIYHGSDESVLQTGVGHLEGSSLPTGEIGNHTVLTGHTGLPTAALFTNLTQMELGDTFELYILDEVYTYEVYNIMVVEPYEVDDLEPIEGKDVVTLVTCTPYGVNSHRLLVQGEQIEVIDTDDAVQTISTEPETSYDMIKIILYVIVALSLVATAVLIYKIRNQKIT